MRTRTLPAKTSAAPPSQAGNRSPLALIVVVLVVVTLGAFARTINQDFINYDDGLNFYQNPHLNPVPDLNLAHIFGHAYFQMYVPVSYLVFALVSLGARMSRPNPQITMSGGSLDPRVFHGVDLLLHLVNVLLVFALLRRLLKMSRAGNASEDHRPWDDWAAGIGALLFAVHPVQVESVAWASQMRGLISGVFSLLALLVAADGSRQSVGRIGSVMVLGLLAVLAKPSAVTLPLVALASDYWLLKRAWRESLILAIPWLLIVSPFVLIAGHVQPTPAGIGGPLWGRLFIAGDAMAFYLAKLAWPLSLGIDYGRTPGFVLGHWWGYATWLVPAATTVLVVLFRKERPWLVAGAMTSLVLLLPVLGLTPFIFQQFSTVADRYLYLVMLGPALIVAFAVRSLSQGAVSPVIGRDEVRPAIGGVAVLLGICLFLTTRQMAVWDDSVSLMRHALRVNPKSFIGHLNLGSALVARGDASQALPNLQAALAMQPDDPLVLSDLGLSYLDLDRPQDAIAVLSKATDLVPSDADAHNALGLAYLVSAQPAQAVPEFRAAVRLQPDSAASYDHLGRALQQTGRLPDAEGAYRRALQLDPLLVPAYCRLGDVLTTEGNLPSALDAYTACLGHDPSDLDAYLGLSTVEAKRGDTAKAIQALRTALSYHPDSALAQSRLQSLLGK